MQAARPHALTLTVAWVSDLRVEAEWRPVCDRNQLRYGQPCLVRDELADPRCRYRRLVFVGITWERIPKGIPDYRFNFVDPIAFPPDAQTLRVTVGGAALAERLRRKYRGLLRPLVYAPRKDQR